MKTSVLFVDDSENILQGLRRNLHTMRQEWDMHFAIDGTAALKIVKEKAIDVVVSDVRMPGMDGAELLQHVKNHRPGTIRMTLSGQCEEEVIIRLLGVSHQYMAKPFEAKAIIGVISRILADRACIQDDGLKEFIPALVALPSLPDLQGAIVAMLKSDNPSKHDLEDMFLRDISLLAKLFQIMNSSYFGTNQDINTIAYLWELLSLEKIRSLVLEERIVTPINAGLGNDPFIQNLWRFSLATARVARAIAKTETLPQKASDKAWVAGLLHGIGALALYEYQRQKKDAIDHANLLNLQAGDSYTVVGGFLSSLWGLPRDIHCAILNHAAPSNAKDDEDKNILAIAHAAWGIAKEKSGQSVTIDEAFLEKAGAGGKMAVWRASAADVSF